MAKKELTKEFGAQSQPNKVTKDPQPKTREEIKREILGFFDRRATERAAAFAR